jgi:hypothetical protein
MPYENILGWVTLAALAVILAYMTFQHFRQ